MPRVSVLLPVHNAAPWLRASIRSLSRQRFRDFEIVAVDDGSTDSSPALLEELAEHESRLRVLHRPHAGLPTALQTAWSQAQGEYLMRHDADDLSLRDRMEAQVRHLDSHPEDGVVGCRVRLFPDHAHGIGMQRWVRWHDALLTDETMRHERLIDSPLCHGTAMLRQTALTRVQGWRECGWAEDMDLWVRMFDAGVRLAKLPRRLYAWRQHPTSSTRVDPRYSRAHFTALKHDAIARWLGTQRATLIGSGASLQRWQETLGALLQGTLAARSPHRFALGRLERPLILAFMAPSVRKSWREYLADSGMAEGHDFIFIA